MQNGCLLHDAAAATCKMPICGHADRQRVKREPKFVDHKCGCVGIKIHNNGLLGEGEI